MSSSKSIERLERRVVLAAGDLDPSFGEGGKVTTDLDGQVSDSDTPIAVLPRADGKVVVVADAVDFQSDPQGETHRAAVVRYNADGSLDSNFDGDGVVFTAIEGWEDFSPKDAALMWDGGVLVHGTVSRPHD